MRDPSSRVRKLVEPAVEAMGYELVGVQYRSGRRNALLRVYIDSERGIGVDDCERVSRQVSALLDVEDPIAGSYTLEVSSPGLDRPLFERAHFERFKGATVKVRTAVPIDGQRNFTGVLEGCRGDAVVVVQDGVERVLPLTQVDSARLVPDV